MINLAQILKHNVIGKLLNHVIVFLINIFLVRSLGAGGSGTFFNELYLLNFIVFIFSAGLDYATIALLPQQPGLLYQVNKMLFRITVLFSFLMLIYGLVFLGGSHNYFKQPIVTILLFSIGNMLLIFYQGVLSALKKFNAQNFILIGCNLVFIAYLFISYTYGITIGPGVESLYALLFFVQGLIVCGYAFSFGKKPAHVFAVNWSAFIRRGIYIMISSLVYFAFLRIDNFFVQKYTDPVTLGNYVQCGKVGQYFLYFSSAISATLLPFIASETVGSSVREWKRMMKPYIILLCIGALLIALFGKILFPFFFGPDFTTMYSFMIILLPGYVCLGGLTLLNALYIGKGNIKRILIGDILGLLMVTGFDIWLIPTYGAYGAAIISSTAYCIVFLYLLSGFKKQFLLPAKSYQ